MELDADVPLTHFAERNCSHLHATPAQEEASQLTDQTQSDHVQPDQELSEPQQKPSFLRRILNFFKRLLEELPIF